MSELSTVQVIAVMAVPLILAIVLHEVAHGYVAYLKGDPTAKYMGRLTLNPIAHVDPFGTLLLPLLFYLSTGFLFAYAKPVPVNFMNLRRPKEDMVWVAAAGPGTNLVLAVVSALLLNGLSWVFPEVNTYLNYLNAQMVPAEFSILLFPITGMLFFSVVLNVVLAVINLIPIPPADGGRITVGLLPPRQAEMYSKIEPIGLILLLFIVFFNPFNILTGIIWPAIVGIVELLI